MRFIILLVETWKVIGILIIFSFFSLLSVSQTIHYILSIIENDRNSESKWSQQLKEKQMFVLLQRIESNCIMNRSIDKQSNQVVIFQRKRRFNISFIKYEAIYLLSIKENNLLMHVPF